MKEEIQKPIRFHRKNATVHAEGLQKIGIDPEVERPFRKALKSIRQLDTLFEDVNTARKMLLESPRAPMQKQIAMKSYADKKQNDLDELAGIAERELQKYVDSINSEIDSAMQKKAATSNFARATWDHLKSMEDKQTRKSFIRGAINNEDWDTVDDILGVNRPFLIGLEQKDVESLREQYKKARYADKIAARDYAIKMLSEFETNSLNAAERLDKFNTPEVREAIAKENKTQDFLNG